MNNKLLIIGPTLKGNEVAKEALKEVMKEVKPDEPIHTFKNANGRWKLRESERNDYLCWIEKDHTREDVLSENYFAAVSKGLHSGDIVRAIREDFAFFSELLVLETKMGFVRVAELRYNALPPRSAGVEDRIPNGFRVFDGGPIEGWCIERLADNVSLGKNFSDREKAVRHLLDHATLKS